MNLCIAIAGHFSRAMLSRYFHERREAKRHAVDKFAARQRAADEMRKEEARRQTQVAAPFLKAVRVFCVTVFY